MKRQIKDLIMRKGLSSFKSIGPKSSISYALEVLQATNSSALLVTENKRLKGIFSEKDFARAAIRGGVQLFEEVGSIMTSRVYYAEPSFTLEECLQIMSKVHVRHLPIMEDHRPIALVSMRHIMEALVEDQATQIRDLTTYITGASSVIDFEKAKRAHARMPIYNSNFNQEVL